ncbi:MAG TPA: calcium/proton exchanger [Chthonomonadales bacterium]|nr:calcium/proton exchanger [Chthonomonadales bacterium]
MKWLLAMSVFVPISVILSFTHAQPVLVFITASLAIIPLAGFMGIATEELAKYFGPSLGGLLNATFGNAAELIIVIMAVRADELDLVRASIAGSIIGNILLVLGLSIFLGGLKYKVQKFDENVAGAHTVMMVLAVIAIFTPSLFVHAIPGTPDTAANPRVENLSLWMSGLLIALYLGGLLYSLHTHQDMFRGGEEEEREPPHWSKFTSYLVLGIATALVAWESEILVHAVEPTVQALQINKLFVGVILIPIIGNAAEHATAIVMAVKDKMNISLNICVSSSTQIALFITPLIVFLSIPLGHPMPFIFNDFELIAVGFSALIAAFIARDGRCDWLEGAQLLAVYVILALAFYFIPH